MRSKISILIPDGEDDRALIVIRSLAYSRNVKIHVLSPIKKSVHLSRYCKFHLLPLSENNNEGRMKNIIQLSKTYRIDVLLPIGLRGLEFIYPNYQSLNSLFSLPPIPDIEKFNIVKDKWNLNEFCRSNGFSYLNAEIVNRKEYYHKDLDNLPEEVILKTRTGEGGIGIKYFDSKDLLLHELNLNNEFLSNNNYLKQEYIDGGVISFNAICKDGKVLVSSVHQPAISSNKTFTFARIIELIENNDVQQFGKELLLALKWNGMANIDLIFNNANDKLYIIDFNPRYFGTMLGLTKGGINYPYLSSLLALGETISQPEYKNIIFAILNIKQISTWITGKDGLKGVQFKNTNFSFILKDPMPALVLSLKGVLLN